MPVALNLIAHQFGTTSAMMENGIHRKQRCKMGSVGIKINGEWLDLMSAFIACQLCNEPVQIRELAEISSDSVNGIVTWQCAKCKAVNG